jgi:hypothetical protein
VNVKVEDRLFDSLTSAASLNLYKNNKGNIYSSGKLEREVEDKIVRYIKVKAKIRGMVHRKECL